MTLPQQPKPVPRLRAGDRLVHWVLPVWIGSGALLKLFAGSPTELPNVILHIPAYLWDLGIRQSDYSRSAWQVFMLVIGAELVIAILLALHRRWARLLAIVTLVTFIAVLIATMQQGMTSCGCFGTIETPPWVMLLIDGVLLLGCLALPFTPRAKRPVMTNARWGAITLASLVAVGGAWVMFKRDLVGMWGSPAKLVAFDLMRSSGRAWRDAVLFKLLPISPADFTERQQTWVLYRDTCPTCHALFEGSLSTQTPGVKVIGVKVPAPGATPYELPAHVVRTSLPEGKEYVVQTPMIVVIEGDRIISVSNVKD